MDVFFKRLDLLLTISALALNSQLSADIVDGSEGPIEIMPLVHSSVQLEYRGFVVQVDPWAPIDISTLEKASIDIFPPCTVTFSGTANVGDRIVGVWLTC